MYLSLETFAAGAAMSQQKLVRRRREVMSERGEDDGARDAVEAERKGFRTSFGRASTNSGAAFGVRMS